jgi:predicted ATPase
MIGTTLFSRYHLVAAIGQGSMGTVYRAHDMLLDRDVAIKVVTEARLGPEGQARLLSEARAAARLNHPNLIAIYDVAEASDPAPAGRGIPFIVMELAEGQSLDRRGNTSVDDTLAVARQVCAALEHAHAHGIVHRDLKPENVLVTADGTVKLMDFGLAHLISSEEAEPVLTGTVLYLAPEQARGQPVDARADLYALGVMLYEALTGRVPFSGDDPMAVIAQHLNSPPTPPSQLRPDLPPALEAIILKLLAKDPAQRFGAASEVLRALSEISVSRREARPGPNNLPAEITSFIGRGKEIGEVLRLLRSTRLLTLAAAGGTGKTRLALRVAATALNDYRDGAWLVDLAPLADPALVPQSVAASLGVRDEPGTPPMRRIADALHHKHLLLILDNCEHLIEAAALLAEALLRSCPDVNLLVTSRESLGIAGETTYRVPSLSVPHEPAGGTHSAAEAGQFEAVRLFVERAASVQPGFVLSDSNAAAVAQICRRLDGVPLALELAAARMSTLSVEQIAARLDDRFRLLTGGSRTALPRQQTLRALMDWSWDLLAAEEKALLSQLSVFVGGWTLEAVEQTCAGEAAPDVLELLTRLVDKSLVVVETHDGAPRYRLLETIRQYAREKLVASGEAEANRVRKRHLAYYLALAEAAEPHLRTAEQLAWLARLEAEHDNLRAALEWACAVPAPHKAHEAGMRLAAALGRFWYLHSHWSEGRNWLRQALAEPLAAEAQPGLRRARARALASLAWLMDETGEDIPLYDESLRLCRELDDRWGMAFALRGIGATTTNQGVTEGVAAYLDEALDIFQSLDDAWGMGVTLYGHGWLAFYTGGSAAETWSDSLAEFRRSGDRWGMAVVLGALSFIARLRGDYSGAVALTEESLDHFRQIGDKAGIANSLARLGSVAIRRGDYRQATALIEDGMILQREMGEQSGLALSFALLGLIAAYQGEYNRALALLEEANAAAGESDGMGVVPYSTGYAALTHYLAGRLDQASELWAEALELQRSNEDKLGTGQALHGLGLVAWRGGDLDAARRQVGEALELFKQAGDRLYAAHAINDLGRLALAAGDRQKAEASGRKALGIYRDLGSRQGIADALRALATAAGATQGAARLFGAADALRDAFGAPLATVERPAYEASLAALRAGLGEATFEAALRDGQNWPLEDAIAELLAAAPE